MRLILLTFILFWSQNIWAYSRDQIKLTQNEFIVIVRPTLSNVYGDYQNLLVLLGPRVKDYKNLFAPFQSLLKNQFKFIEYCEVTNNLDCSNKISSLLMELQKILTEMKEPEFEQGVVVSNLSEISEYNELKSALMRYYLDLFNFHFLFKTDLTKKSQVLKLEKQFLDLYYQFHLYVISLTEQKYHEMLSDYWNSFIRPIATYVLLSSDKEIFLGQLNNLNLSWNVFHSYVTKRNKEVSSKIQNLMTTMHRRWNAILKSTLR